MPDFFETQTLIQTFEPAYTPALLERSLLVVGVGGNGCHVALAAVRMGFRSVVGVDRDIVSDSNLSRQVLYTRQDAGRKKAEVAAESLENHNLRSAIRMQHLDILDERRRFGELVGQADAVFVVLDQPGTTFFALDTCFKFGKLTISGGTCVMSGLSARVAWMASGQRPCLNCAFQTHPSIADWVSFYTFGQGEQKERTRQVDEQDAQFALAGGHPSTYPTACLGSNLMMAVMLNLLLGRTDVPRQLELSVLGPGLEGRPLRQRKDCPTCSR